MGLNDLSADDIHPSNSSQEHFEQETQSSVAVKQSLLNGKEEVAQRKPCNNENSTIVIWDPRWKALILMPSFWLIGVALALGHHFYYNSKANIVAPSEDQQQWTIRIGSGLAQLTAAALAAATGLAFTQYLWVTVRRKSMSLGSIDAVFSLTSNPTSFFNDEALIKAKVLIIIAVACWLIPFIAAVPPGTLSVHLKMVSNTTVASVPYPIFEDDTAAVADIWSDITEAGLISSASPAVTRILTATSSSMSILPFTGLWPNSSFSLNFYGPSMKCYNLSDAEASSSFENSCLNCTSLEQLWNITAGSLIMPNVFYWGAAPSNGRNLLFVQTGGAVGQLSGSTLGLEQTVCQLVNASYAVDFSFFNGIQTTVIRDLQLQSDLTYDLDTLVQSLPTSGGRAYIAMFQALSTLLSGTVGGEGSNDAGMQGADLPVVKTGIVACPEVERAWNNVSFTDIPPVYEIMSSWMCRNGSVGKAIEDLSQNFTLSLLSVASFSSPNPPFTTDVRLTFPQNFWNYQPKDLIISYLVGAVASLLCVVMGAWAVYANGCSADSSFSKIILTTRNPQLDALVKNRVLTSDSPNKSLKNCKLQYGIIHQEGKDFTAFGSAEQIAPLRNALDRS